MTWICTRHKWEFTTCNLKPDISFDKKKKTIDNAIKKKKKPRNLILQVSNFLGVFFSAHYYESLDNLLADYDFKVKISLKSCWKWMVYAICL